VETPFTHLDGDGRVRMVDVSDKEPTRRRAEASCVVRSHVDAFSLPAGPGGLDPVFAARLAGIQAAKRTAQLIPLCHPINLNDVQVEVTNGPDGVIVRATVVTVNRTGVEMEALTACSFAALSLVNALVAHDARARFEDLVLERKTGGKSDDWGRRVSPDEAATGTNA
jgi:cyclic pyranopterin monophosphate synthase